MTEKRQTMPVSAKVTLVNAARSELHGRTVLRGVVDPESLRHLLTPKYQREILSENKISKLMDALRDSSVPDIDLGMRGTRFRQDGTTFTLLDPTYIIDGLQRTTSGIRLMNDDPPGLPSIGATVWLGTEEAWERKMFTIWNLDRTKLSTNVILKNAKEEVPAINSLFRLANSQTFVLRSRIQWGQSPRKSEVLTANTYVKVAGRLQSHVTPGGRSSDVRALLEGVDRIMTVLGGRTFTDNVRAFFELIEDAWGLTNVEYRGSPQLMVNFLLTFATVLSDHEDFWKGNELAVPASKATKLKSFKIREPYIMALCGGGGPATDLLYDLLVKHINSGTRAGGKLQQRPRSYPSGNDDEE